MNFREEKKTYKYIFLYTRFILTNCVDNSWFSVSRETTQKLGTSNKNCWTLAQFRENLFSERDYSTTIELRFFETGTISKLWTTFLPSLEQNKTVLKTLRSEIEKEKAMRFFVCVLTFVSFACFVSVWTLSLRTS